MLDDTQKTSRRSFLQHLTVLGTAGVITPAVLSACGGGQSNQEGAESAEASLDCTDTSGLTEQELQMRQNAQYVDASTQPDKHCSNCQLFQPAAEANQCGTCQVIKGPINPQGYCNLWVAKSA